MSYYWYHPIKNTGQWVLKIISLRYTILILSSIHVFLMFNFHRLYFSLIFIWGLWLKEPFFSHNTWYCPRRSASGSHAQATTLHQWLETTFLFYSSKHWIMLSHKYYAAQTECLYLWACYCPTIHRDSQHHQLCTLFQTLISLTLLYSLWRSFNI